MAGGSSPFLNASLILAETLQEVNYFSPIRPSVPACNRLMFSRCM